MSSPLPPNDALAEFISAMGDDNVRKLVGTFLRDFPNSMRDLAVADRKNGRRIAHRMKSEARMMGATALAQRMLELQERLTPEIGRAFEPSDLVAIQADFDAIAPTLRRYVGD